MQPPTAAELHWLYNETSCRLDTLAAGAREGHRIDEASNFCRWLRGSGVVKMFERNPAEMPLPVNAASINAKIEEILDICGQHYAGKKVSPNYRKSDIEAINAKLEMLMERLPPVAA